MNMIKEATILHALGSRHTQDHTLALFTVAMLNCGWHLLYCPLRWILKILHYCKVPRGSLKGCPGHMSSVVLVVQPSKIILLI